MDENLTPVDAGQVSDEGSQVGAEQTTTDSAEGGAATVTVEKPVQTPEENAKFAAIRREAEARARQAADEAATREKQRADALMARLFKEQGYTSLEQVEDALRQQELAEEAARQQVPVDLLVKLQSTEATARQALDRLSQFERKEQMTKEAETISADPKWGQFFKGNEADIRNTADKYGCNLEAAMLAVYRNVGPQAVDEEAIANKAIQDYLDKKRSFKPVEGSGSTPVTVVDKPKTFEEAGKAAAAIFRASREQS